MLSNYLTGIWDAVFNSLATFRDIENLGKFMMRDIFWFIRDICLFTSRDIGYLVLPYTSLYGFCFLK